MQTRIWTMAALVAALAVGCGGVANSDGSGGTAGTAGSGASAGSGGSGATAGTGGGAGTGGSAGAGGSQSCEDFHDQTPPPSGITVRLTNKTSSPIYLGDNSSCGAPPLYDLWRDGAQVRLQAGGCGNTCQALQQHDDLCAGACMQPPVIVIFPGGHYDASWSGTEFRSAQMPTECYYSPEFAPPVCDQRVIAQQGDYAVTASAWTEVACLDVGICPCQPDASGSCEMPYSGVPGGTEIDAKAALTFPGQGMVELVFE